MINLLNFVFMFELYIAVLASLFSLVNPLGAIPVFLAMTPQHTKEERKKIALHTSLYVCLILIAFYFAGTLILGFFGISINAMRIAGGLVILSSGYSLLGGHFAESRAISKSVREEALVKDDISFSPMAMPLLSGPGSISLLIGLYGQHPSFLDRIIIIAVVLTLGLITFLILRSAPYLQSIMGVSGLKALSRIMGFIVMAIGVQYIIGGGVELIKLNI
jgi:multiple antibiotic resistance protein